MDKIAILDFGGQYAHLIANRVRKLNVYSEILDGETPASELRDYKGIILSGGPQSVYDEDSIKCDNGILELGVPLLGICYGHQLLAYMQGAKVEADKACSEYGLAEMEVRKAEGIFAGLDFKETVWMSHGDSVKSLPKGYEIIGSSKLGQWVAIANFEKNFYGVQFHLEVTHTVSGMKMLDNFLSICGVSRDWDMDRFILNEIELIKQKIGDKKVFMMVSGGVDSTVAYSLLAKSIGEENVHGLFVDTGFLRLNEREKVQNALKNAGLKNLIVKDASDIYFKALNGIYHPEAKRKVIGDLFLRIQEQVVKDLNLNPDDWLIGQGTIYPDTIESGGSKHSSTIKTHHNRVNRVLELIEQGKIIEPLVQLYKDEVRAVGEKLGLSSELVWRHPFPGPGLAVRCLCAQEEVFPENHIYLEDNINETLKNTDLKVKILPIFSVGVQGDYRSYKHPLVFIGQSSFFELNNLATDIINHQRDVNRALWLLSPNQIESVKVQVSDLNRDRIALLQKADDVVDNFIKEKGIDKDIWQFPTVLIPVSINSDVGESVVLRPVESSDAMTANFYHMDLILLNELVDRLKKLDGISAVFYDITNKPPGTIEWE